MSDGRAMKQFMGRAEKLPCLGPRRLRFGDDLQGLE